MTCITQSPRCGSKETVKEGLDKVISGILFVFTILGVLISLGKFIKELPGIVAWLGGATVGGVLAGVIGAAIVLTIIALSWNERCSGTDGNAECIAGVVHNIKQDFSDLLDEIFPFTAMHDRVDLVLKSKYWDKVENNAVHVFCTQEAYPRQSEIMRCYYYTKRVCNAAKGAMIGGATAAVGGIIAAAIIAAAIGCATVILCLFAILLAILVAAIAVLIGAFIGGQIGKAVSDEGTPSDSSGSEISIGDLITINGIISTRDYDDGANVIWWVDSSSLSGRVPNSTPDNPFSYCDINNIFLMDACPVIID